MEGNLETRILEVDCLSDWDSTITKGAKSTLFLSSLAASSSFALHEISAKKQGIITQSKVLLGGTYFMLKDRLRLDVTEQIKYCASYLKGLDFGYAAAEIAKRIDLNPGIEIVNDYFPQGGTGEGGKVRVGILTREDADLVKYLCQQEHMASGLAACNIKIVSVTGNQYEKERRAYCGMIRLYDIEDELNSYTGRLLEPIIAGNKYLHFNDLLFFSDNQDMWRYRDYENFVKVPKIH